MALKFSMILEAVDRATAPARRARSSIARLTGGIRQWGQGVRRVSRDITNGSRSIEHYERRARRLRQVALGTFFRAAGQQARRFAAQLRAGIRNLDLMGRAGRGAKAGLGWLGGKALGAAKWAAAGASAALGFSGFDLLKTAGQFEQYQVSLEGTEGSVAGAKKAMAWVQKFAKDTPYELDQVMEAFIALKSYGIDPMNGSLMSLGDGSSGMSKELSASVEALADAVTGEYERLKEFGIRASTAGNKVTFSYRKNGKDIQRTVKSTGSEIEKAITGIFSDRFGGGMARQSKTMFGIMSSLQDLWKGFLLQIASAGIFDKIKAKLNEWRAGLEAMVNDGRLQAWAEKISETLEQAFDWAVDFIEKTNWDRVGRDLQTIGQALVIAANAIKEIATAGPKVRFTVDALSGVPGWLKIGKQVYDAASQGGGAARPAMPPTQRERLWNNAQPGRSWIKRPGASGTTSGWTRLPKAGAKTPGASPVAVGGTLDINVKVQGGGTATVSRVATVNRDVPINARVGKMMGAPA